MANGTIAFDTLSTSGQISGTAKSVDTDYLANGVNKVWVNFDGSASGAASNDSLNVSGMTDNGTGDYTTSFTNNMGNTNYCHLVHAIVASYYTQYLANSFAKATGSYREEQDSFDGSSTTTNRDHTHCNLGILGDLA